MSNWPYRQLSDFLIEREGRFKPNDPEIASYKRLDKIDFSGRIHISEKPSKTDMIIIEPGDLVISGINVAKGALAVYDGDEPVTATIHYSSYQFNKNKIDIEFLKRFLKSPAFISELQDQVKGGIKTEIKPKHLLPLKARIPELNEQQKINHHFDAIENEISDLSNEVNAQSSYLTKLRQAILQEAIEGKLTADWRKEQEESLAKDAELTKVSLGELRALRKKDPNYSARALLEKIQAEKEKLIKEGKIKKQKPLAPIKTEEVPFDLPEGWVWTRLGEVCNSITYGTSEKCSYEDSKNAKVIRIPNVSSGYINNDDLKFAQLSENVLNELSLKHGDILTIRSNGSPEIVGTMAFVTKSFEDFCFAGYLIRLRFLSPLIGNFLSKVSRTKFIRCQIEDPLRTTVGINNINTQELSNLSFPLAPLSEQQAIVECVENLLSMVDELEKQVFERKEQSEQLMQSVLREAFEGKSLAKNAKNAKEKINA